ncbi:MAG TPA: hypothetical protein VLD57_06835, partial [Blastocatellia bacterium]|nr:hypothetical protein [Blastocatellia bacterium]
MRTQGNRSIYRAAVYRIRSLASLALCALTICAASAHAQSYQLPPPPLPVDPTPLEELLSPQERELIRKESNPQKIVDAYLKISDAHLDAALAATNGSDTARAERELDIYNKTIAEAAKVAFTREDKKRRLSKKIEQRLYKQIKTLESIERLFPAERVPFAEAALKQARQTRIQALNAAFAAGDILKDPDEEKKPGSGTPGKNNPPHNFVPPGGNRFISA